MKHSSTNEELMQLLSQDNERAFTELYQRFWQTLFAIAYNRLKEIPTAEDIVHDVFASLWKNRHTVKVDSLENYLATAVKYMVLAQVKKQAHARKYQSQTTALYIPAMAEEDSVHYRRILAMVQEEINQLPEKCRLIFRCSREQGMSTRQIAQSLHISPKTVDNQLHKALTHLRLKMKHILFNMLSVLC